MFPPETRILLVDDSHLMRQLVRRHLENLGFEEVGDAESAANGWEAMVKAHSEAKPFGLVLLDYMMPGLNGIELLLRLRADERFAKVPIIFLTAEGETEHMEQALAAGAESYLIKPFHREDLMRKLTAVFQSVQARPRKKNAR